jgi:hypothetical protein
MRLLKVSVLLGASAHSQAAGKKTVEVVTHSHSAAQNGYVNSLMFRLQERTMFSLLDGISPESKGVLNGLDLKKTRTQDPN